MLNALKKVHSLNAFVWIVLNSKINQLLKQSRKKHFTKPETVEELEPGWCRYTNKLNDVSFVLPNDFFKVIDNKIILECSQSSKNFDVVYFAPRDIKEVAIPSYIKEIHPYAFSDCLKLERVTIEEDSKLEKIGNESFSYSSVKKNLYSKTR